MRNDAEEESPAIRVGRIVKPHGIKGAVIVESHTDFPDQRYAPGQTITLEGHPELSRLTVREARAHQGRILLETRELDSIDRAETTRDLWLTVPVEDSIQPDEEEYYGHDLVGLEVVTREGEPLGTVEAVLYPEQNPTLEIHEASGDVLDFPAHPDLVMEVDPDEARLVVRLPRGWEKLRRA